MVAIAQVQSFRGRNRVCLRLMAEESSQQAVGPQYLRFPGLGNTFYYQ